MYGLLPARANAASYMKIMFWFIGKTADNYLDEGLQRFEKRLKHYLPVEVEVLADVKGGGKLPPEQLKLREAEAVLARLKPEDALILLDERGNSYRSAEFARWLDQQLQQPYRRLILLVGGAYGFAPALYERSQSMLSLSKMTFSHQMVRLFLLEQVYRAMTILRNEPYHNE